MSTSNATTVLREFGRAIRGCWGSIDGRSIRTQLDMLADWIDAELVGTPTNATLTDMRELMDVCPYGHGHWTEYCGKACEQTPVRHTT